jgi:hypothetical protein
VTEFEALWKQMVEIRSTWAYLCVGIRVTPLALRGSIVSVPASPERERVLRSRVDPNKSEGSAGLIEILVHPDDWDGIRRDRRIRTHVGADQITQLLGLPVVVESGDRSNN